MDNSGRPRRQNEPPMSSNNPRYPSLHDQQRRGYGGSSREGYRPAPLSTSPTAAAAAAAAAGQRMGGSAGYGQYYQDSAATFNTGAMQQNTMGYHQAPADYGQADTRQTQGFATGAYNPNMMYNVQPPGGSQSAAVYDTSQGFSQRQPAGLQMMTADVATPYFQSEPGAAAAAAAAAQQSGSGAASYQQQPGLQGYSTGGMSAAAAAAAAAAAVGGMAGQTGGGGGGGGGADAGAEDEYAASGSVEEAYAEYQAMLKEVFQNVRNGALAAASEGLLSVSVWLLSNVTQLGTLDRVRLPGEDSSGSRGSGGGGTAGGGGGGGGRDGGGGSSSRGRVSGGDDDRRRSSAGGPGAMGAVSGGGQDAEPELSRSPGLNIDDKTLRQKRVKLWDDFNHAWLALFQRQKEFMESASSGHQMQLQRGQSLIAKEGLEKMGRELVKLCDVVEPHGLVDYQYGVWEERIMEVLEECLNQYEASDDSSGNAPAGVSSSHHHR